MARIHIPLMKPVPENATVEDRRKMFEEHKAKLIKLNPSCFNTDGTVKTIWQRLTGLF